MEIKLKRQNRILKIALGKSQSHIEQLIEEIRKNPSLAKEVNKDLLIVGKGGDITLEEKLLLKDEGELAKYSFTPQHPLSPKSSTFKHGPASPKVYEHKPRAFVDYITELRLSKEDFASELERYLAKQDSRFQSVISNIKALLEKEKVKNRKLSTNLANKQSEVVRDKMLGLFEGTEPSKASKKKMKAFSMSSIRYP